jgi:hypothetical protein
MTYNCLSVEREDGFIDTIRCINERRHFVGFRWFNLIGFVMLLFALFLNEVVYLNVWYDFNFAVIVPAILYLGVGLWLSLWGGPRRQDA